MRYLIAGGAGFIGSNLIARLLKDGHSVICMDNFLTGSHSNTNKFITSQEYFLIKHDVRKECEHSILNRVHIDRVINLACPASPVHYQLHPIETIMTNVMGTENLLKIAQKHGARFLQASTSEVYGDPAIHPQKEEYWGNVNCYGPRACYDEGKRLAETLIYEYQRKASKVVDCRIMRIFNTYGPNMAVNDGRVVSNFIVQALRGEAITIYGDGSQSRSFCYIDDLIDGMLGLLDCAYDEPVNLGNPKEFTIRDLAQTVSELVTGKPEFTTVQDALPKDDPTQRCPDISKAQLFFNFNPKVPLNDGLVKTIEYFKTVI